MKRIFLIAAAVLATTSCAVVRNVADRDSNKNPYENPFYAKYLNTGSTLDAQIGRTLDALRANPDSPELHNALGTLLVDKGFPKDAEREFERSVNANRKYYPAWYNLGLVRAASGDELGARRAFSRTVDLKPGHAAALFQLGLIEEKREHIDRAVSLYAKAYGINPALLDVDVNPRILDTNLTHLALLKLYPNEHTRRTMQFQGGAISSVPATGSAAPAKTAPSPQPAPKDIVPPTAPATDRSVRPPSNAQVVPSEQSPLRRDEPAAPRDTRGRRRRAQQEEEQQQQPAAQPQVELYAPSATPQTTIR